MDKDKIMQRITDLQARQEQLVANLNAVHGAIQECQYWLSQLEQKETGEA